ncbi:hypothetical protein G3A43_08660 [Paraburkholderia aspalathi]|nr:hypothetical protein [Paraburkholderia aspalathi]MBK3780328.1 hypothetical protein [Paraburkholderia aspalathi]
MVEAALEVLGGLFEDIIFFQWGGVLALIVGVLWLCVYAGSQMELADVQACEAHNACTVSTEQGFFHVPVRHLVTAPPVVVAPGTSAAKPAGK